MPDDATHLYFAYGSNLDATRLRERCFGARVVGRATLHDHRLAFAGHSRTWGGPVATLVRAPGGEAPGLLYALQRTDLAALDRYEGAPRVYRRSVVEVVAADGRSVTARTYMLPESTPAGAPPPDYVRVIFHAYGALGFDQDALLATARPPDRADPARPHRVFVHGPALAGEGAASCGLGRTPPGFELLAAEGGAALVERSGGAVLGEVYAVDDATLAALDARMVAALASERARRLLRDGRDVEMYLAGAVPAAADVVVSGDWHRARLDRG